MIEAEKILQKDPENIEALHFLGILAAQRQDFAAARKFIQNALKNNPESPALHNSMGNIFKNLGKLDNAKTHYEKALELKNDYAVAHNSLGNIFSRRGNITTAQYHYQQALKLKPDYADAYYNLALISPQNIVRFLKKATELQPDHPEAHHKIAEIFQQQGKLDEAIYHYKECLKIVPDNSEIFHNLGAIFLRKHNPSAALKYFLRLLQFNPDFDTYYNLGVIYMYQDRYNDAIQYFKQALIINGKDFATYSNLGAVYLKVEDYKNAIEYYTAAKKLQPKNQEVIYILNAITQKQTPEAAPQEYIQNLFDQYAPYFDEHLTKMLDYRVPDLLLGAIEEVANKKMVILDLGCGTGLTGQKLRPLAQKLIGIDISKMMIEEAKHKNCYDELAIMDINKALVTYKNLDLIVAADTLVYLGDLSTIFSNCKRALNLGGIFVFTIEKTYQYPYELQRSARFAHSKKYIEKLAEQNSFQIVCCNNIILRKQRSGHTEGYIYLLKFLQF